MSALYDALADLADARDVRNAAVGPSLESRIHQGLVSDIVSAVARNRPEARIECCRGTMDLVSVLTEALAYKPTGDAFIAALSDVLNGKDAAKLVDWVETAANEYASHNADLIAMEGD